MGGGADILVLLLGEDVDAHHVDLGVAVLAGLGGAHLHDLAGAALDHDEAVLAQGGALHRVGRRGAGIALGEIVLIGHRGLRGRLKESGTRSRVCRGACKRGRGTHLEGVAKICSSVGAEEITPTCSVSLGKERRVGLASR